MVETGDEPPRWSAGRRDGDSCYAETVTVAVIRAATSRPTPRRVEPVLRMQGEPTLQISTSQP